MVRAGFNTLSLVLILVAFVFLLLATISTPVVQSFSLASTDTHKYGIFGYCFSSRNSCLKASYPYSLDDAHDSTSNWLLLSSSRETLAKVFIVAPIALGLNFFTLAVIVATHFNSKAIALFAIVLNIISFIATTIVAIIVVLVFYPNLNWTGWILIGAAAANLISLVSLFLSLTFNSDSNDDIHSNESIDRYVTGADSEKQGFSSNFAGPASISNIPPPNPTNYDTSSSYSKDFESKASNPYNRSQTTNFQVTPHQQRAAYGTNPPPQPQGFKLYDKATHSSNSSVYNDAIQTANDFTHPDVAPNLVASSAGVQQPSNLSYPRNHVRDSGVEPVYPMNHSSVFEHHPEVEGHKPFTEMDDFELEDYGDDERVPLNNCHNGQQVGTSGNESDADSDFTSVSQRAPNPSYGAQQGYYPVAQAPHSQQFQQNQQFHQQPSQQYYKPVQQNTAYGGFQPQPQINQPARQSVSDNALANNPDFNVGGPRPAKRRVQQGFVPVANRYNKSAASSSMMGRGGARSGPYGVI
ncbi:pali-domain-containing protein [Suhomyces tanzawaensis NRRL Y-17324]|uniref:Pali-domain-containing protein n=1 Tax=Suhomyces tanzawaensis NRRL Y-17324 TaxID=984487 RepID=A0A1E4SF42_9ASCO|nr:pali-domain-containing protein [Suhomyces tanzawaensis NRRL Y-17324]ODV78110.1 pali-domain-containing protein [Suhomyces tanzawaensis NRRL Y-17324]